MWTCRKFQYRRTRIGGLLILYLLWVLDSGCAAATVDSQASTNKVRPAVVQIVFQDLSPSAKRPGATIIGSGFIVNKEGYVLTARHVINFGLERLSENPTRAEDKWMSAGLVTQQYKDFRGNIYEENFVGVDFDVLGEDVNNDLVLLKLRRNPFKDDVAGPFTIDGTKRVPLLVGTVTFDTKKPSNGTAIAISGYPFQKPILVTNSGSIKNSSASAASEGTLLKDIYIADAIVHPGNSGGPAYAVESGLVIGVCLGRGDRVSGIMPARYAIELLKKYSVSWADLGN